MFKAALQVHDQVTFNLAFLFVKRLHLLAQINVVVLLEGLFDNLLLLVESCFVT